MDDLEKVYAEIESAILYKPSKRLEHQYHYGCMYLSACLLGESPRVWREYIINQLDIAHEFGTLGFIEESIVLAMQYTDCQDKALLKMVRDKNRNSSPTVYHALDYRYLDYFNANRTQELLNSVKFCESSGLLYDTFDGSKGSKDLVYHCRNLEILIKSDIIYDAKGREIISRALSLVIKLLDEGTASLFFGRSQNSSYGLGSLYFILNSICFEDNESQAKLEVYKDSLLGKIRSIHTDKCGFRTNLSYGRSGCDSYMYSYVYSSFLLSRLLLSNRVKNNPVTCTVKDIALERYFRIKKVADITLVINSGEGNNSPIFPDDIRYCPSALVSYVKNGREYSPTPFLTLPYSPLDSIFTRKLILVVNSQIYRLLSKFQHLNVFNAIDLEGINGCKRVSTGSRGVYLKNCRRLNFGIAPTRLLEVIKSNYFSVAAFKLPTSTGMEKFSVIVYW